ncbi:M1 family metallopeptidase [Chitinophaga polysaccharea]|uniref:M1 family metallopeptidase n=1 Tax=Chitinophaga TaxID=79328 RepID=UPI0014553CB0|nr:MULTISPECIES: M1 family metallopeptidase [Chitinophaga]NLR57938.1 M1 family metallopeptidase [Chitinophaga polysaccharea]NLU93531.1 M1 family metallopeptidase [Chitinophaga sp. Ak27]
MRKVFFFLLLAATSQVIAQTPLYMPLGFKKAYDRQTRSYSGAPGSKYWQNKAGYDIQVNFDPATNRVAGTETIQYTNNSPDTLYSVNFKLFPNIFQKGAVRNMPVSADDLTDGVVIKNMKINGNDNPVMTPTKGTNMPVNIPALYPGQSLKFNLDFSYILNENTHIRTGSIDTGAYFIAYFFPRIAVYDDINGWDMINYMGMLEFYNDFSDFRVAITVPGAYQVWATGDLKNTGEVYADKYVQRIAAAEKSNDIITVIDTSDIRAGNISPKRNTNTWRFEAINVPDFAFALSNHYCWNATSVQVDNQTKRRTRVDVAFNPNHADFFDVVRYARITVDKMSHYFPKWPFPYSHETVFDGLDQMEYPMMVNDNPLSDKVQAIELTDHEVFHTMFPFYMGTNETLYAWMDEGWATIGEWIISPCIDSTIIDDYGIAPYNYVAGKAADLPIITPSNQLTDAYVTNSYPKPALGYLYVKDMLGDSLFLKALHYYIEQWHGKHPQPYDFFNCMNTGAGRNMNWFWKSWFFDNGYPDLAIGKVLQKGKQGVVEIVSKGTKPVPVDVSVLLEDNSTLRLHRSIACWEKGNKTVSLTFSSPKKIKKVTLGSTWVADINKADNVYEPK